MFLFSFLSFFFLTGLWVIVPRSMTAFDAKKSISMLQSLLFLSFFFLLFLSFFNKSQSLLFFSSFFILLSFFNISQCCNLFFFFFLFPSVSFFNISQCFNLFFFLSFPSLSFCFVSLIILNVAIFFAFLFWFERWTKSFWVYYHQVSFSVYFVIMGVV